MRNTSSTIPTLDRRQLCIGAPALALGMATLSRSSHAQKAGEEVVLAGGRVVTMDDALGEFVTGDVHIFNGDIVGVAARIDAPGVKRVDMSGRIVMPGFVDTHWHMWNTIARGLPSSAAGPFAKTMAALVKAWTPEASGLGVRLACAEATFAGITTVNNWAHNTAGRDFAEAELRAQQGSGLRGRYS